MTVHLCVTDSTGHRAACPKGGPGNLSHNPREVTCRACKRTPEYRRAERLGTRRAASITVDIPAPDR